MKILLSWSSGKDSAWALHVLRQAAPGAVQGLLTTMNETVDRVDWCGENGEFHTCAYDGPMFSHPLAVQTGETVTREPFVWRDILLAEPGPRP
jgi:diphthamide synthase (EF-2-diphthine--ammonia ligase)